MILDQFRARYQQHDQGPGTSSGRFLVLYDQPWRGAEILTSVPPSSAAAGEPTFLGHPKGLLYLAFTEAWERFSFYGMLALLALYMVDQLLLPGHVEHIAGFRELRRSIESLTGPLSPQAFASQVLGLYSGLVYFTPLIGGMIADRWIGQRKAVVIGAISMSAGHIAMVFDRSFLAALLLLVIGSGFIKGNISAQVGALYARDDEARRNHGFVIFSTGINVGAVLGPVVCGFLAQVYGWHYGFGIAAIFMLFGLATYLHGYRFLPKRVARRVHESSRLSYADWRVIGALLILTVISMFQSIAFYQTYNVMPIWMEHHVQLKMANFDIPIPWYISANALSSIVAVPALIWIWRRQALRRSEPGDIAKIGIGAWITAASNAILVAAIALSGGRLMNPIWPFLYAVGLGIAFLYQWPTLLALVARAAPAKVNASMMGIVFLSLFVSNYLIGWLGGYYERVGPANFWALHALIAAAGGLLVAVGRRRLSRALS